MRFFCKILIILLIFLFYYSSSSFAKSKPVEDWGSSQFCSTLGGKEKAFHLDVHTYSFKAKKGEKVNLTLIPDPSGSYIGERATLILLTSRCKHCFYTDRGPLPNNISTVLPAGGEYFVYILEQPKNNQYKSFEGSYCLTLESSKGGWRSFKTAKAPGLAKQPLISWFPERIEETLGKGKSKDLKISFVSTHELKKAKLWITPELRPFIQIEPDFYSSIEANKLNEVVLHLSVPEKVKLGHYGGTIHLRVGSRTYPQTLKIDLNIIDSIPENSAPVANAGPDQVIALAEGQTTIDVQLDGSGSYDPDGTITSHLWTGTPDPEDVVNPTVKLKQGIYEFALQVTDEKGASSSDQTKVTVLGPPLLMPLPEVMGDAAIKIKGISIPGAIINVFNKNTGESKEVTNEKGFFEIPFDLTTGSNEFEAVATYEGIQSAKAKLKTTYTSSRNLIIQSISPSSGAAGSIITITGSGFTPDPKIMGVQFIGPEIEETGTRLESKGVVLGASETEIKVIVPFIFLKSNEEIEVYVYDQQNMSHSLTFHVLPAQDPTPAIKGNEATYQIDLILTQINLIFNKMEQWTKPNVSAETWDTLAENIKRIRYFLEELKGRINSIPNEEVKSGLDAIFGGEFFSFITQELEQINDILSHTTPCDIQRVIDTLQRILSPIDQINRILDNIKRTLSGLIFVNWLGCVTVCQTCCVLLPVLHEVYNVVTAIDSVVDGIRQVFNTVISVLRGGLPTIPTEWKVHMVGPFPGISNHILYTDTLNNLSLYANFTNAGLEHLLQSLGDRIRLRIDIPDPFGIFTLIKSITGVDVEAFVEQAIGRLLVELAIDLINTNIPHITASDILIPSTVSNISSRKLITISNEGGLAETHILRVGKSTGFNYLDLQASCLDYQYPMKTKCAEMQNQKCIRWETDYPRYFETRIIDRPEITGPPNWVRDESCYEVTRCYDWERKEHVCSVDQYRQYIRQLCLEYGKSQSFCDEEVCYDRTTNSYDPMCNQDLYFATLSEWCDRMPDRCNQLIGSVRFCQEYGHWDFTGVGFSTLTQEVTYCSDVHYDYCLDPATRKHICNGDDYKNIILNICRDQNNITCENVISYCCLKGCIFPSCNLDELLVALWGVCSALPERCLQYLHVVRRECSNGPFFKVYWNGSPDMAITGNFQYDSFDLFSVPSLPSLKPGWVSVGVVDAAGNERRTEEIFLGPSPNSPDAQMDVLNRYLYPGETLYVTGNFFSSRLTDNKLTILSPDGQSTVIIPTSGSVGLYTSKDLLAFEDIGEYEGATLPYVQLKVGEHLSCGNKNCAESRIRILRYGKVGTGFQKTIFHGGEGTYYVKSAAIGDLNGDGVNDLAIGVTDYIDPDSGYPVGAVFIKFGPIGGISGLVPSGQDIQYVDFSRADGGWDVMIVGDSNDRHPGGNTRRIGNSLAIGDLNGDGIGDLIIGTTDENEKGKHKPNIEWIQVSGEGHIPGKVYIIWGMRKPDFVTPWPQKYWKNIYKLSNGDYDLRLYGDEDKEFGYQVAVGKITRSCIGYCNGNFVGGMNLVITAPKHIEPVGTDWRDIEKTYVIRGLIDYLPKDIKIPEDLASLRLEYLVIQGPYREEKDVIETNEGIQYVEHFGMGLGRSIAIGDIDGDGLDDIVLGAPQYSRIISWNPIKLQQGAVFLVLGRFLLEKLGYNSWWVGIDDPDTNDFVYYGASIIKGPVFLYDSGKSRFASSVMIADLDGDGKREIAIGAPGSALSLLIYSDITLPESKQSLLDINLKKIGKVYVKDISHIGNPFRVNIESVADLVIHGSRNMSYFGYSLAKGDINGDGIEDLLVGAPGDPGSGTVGRVWVLYGSRSPKWKITDGYDTLHLEHRMWYVTPWGLAFDPRNPREKIGAGTDFVFIGDANSVNENGVGFGISIIVGDLDPYVGDDVVVVDRFGKGWNQGNFNRGPGAAYIFYQEMGDYRPLIIYPETVNMYFCDSNRLLTVSGGLMPYQFRWESCYQTYIGQPPVQIPGPVVCGEDLSLPSNFNVTYGENSVLLRINGCIPNDLKGLSLKVTDSQFPNVSVTREINFLIPDISVSPRNINFGDVEVEWFVNVPITVTNTGNGGLRINDISLTTGSSDIKIRNNCPQMLIPQDSCIIEAIFSPTSEGLATGIVSINSNDPDEGLISINLSGNGTITLAPNIVIIGGNLLFWNVPLGTSSSQDIIIRNSGKADLYINNVYLSGASEFSIISNNCIGAPIPPANPPYPEGTCTIRIIFTPTKTDPVYGNIYIESNDPDTPTFIGTLSGNGVIPALYINPTEIDFSNSLTQGSFYITNSEWNCVDTLEWQIISNLPSWLSVSPMSGSIYSCGGTQTITVQVNREGLQVGEYSHIIGINSNSGSGTVLIKMSVAGFISVTPASLDFAEARKRLSLTIQNTSSDTALTWNIHPDLPPWLTASQMSAVIPAVGSTTVYLYANRSGLNQNQTYSHTLTITSNGGNITIPVSMSVPEPLATFAKYYGGEGGEYFSKIRPTSDGGFIAVGVTNSFGAGPLGVEDAWVVKLDSSGYVEWEKTFGGYWYPERAYDIEQSSDGGYIMVAGTSSFTSNHSYGLWILKLNSYGDIEWQKIYGGNIDDNWGEWGKEFSIQEIPGNGYIVAGHTYNNTPQDYRQDVWILKLDLSGNIQWQKTYGGLHDDYANAIQQTADGGYIVAGVTKSFTADNNPDMWVLKLDSYGNIQWQKRYGSTDWDFAYGIEQSLDGGYIIVGTTWSTTSAWVIKLDASGDIEWQKTYGRYDSKYYGSYGHSIKQTSDGGYILTGVLSSRISGDDIWIVKIDSSGEVIWQKTYRGNGIDVAYSIEEISDGGFVISGYTTSFRSTPGSRQYDAFVMKVDSIGNIGSSCDLTDLTNITYENTNFSSVDTSATVRDSNATPQDTNAIITDSSSISETVCSETLPQAGQRPLYKIDVSPRKYDFGYVSIGDTASTIFTVENKGYNSLTITGISLSGSSDFTGSHTCPLTPELLGIAKRCGITVFFTPSIEGDQSANLYIESNDPLEQVVVILIAGTGWEEEESPGGEEPPGGIIIPRQ